MLSSRFSRVLSSISSKSLKRTFEDAAASFNGKNAIYAEGEVRRRTPHFGLGLSRRTQVAIRTLIAWAIYQGVVLILYLPHQDDWSTEPDGNAVIDAFYFGKTFD